MCSDHNFVPLQALYLWLRADEIIIVLMVDSVPVTAMAYHITAALALNRLPQERQRWFQFESKRLLMLPKSVKVCIVQNQLVNDRLSDRLMPRSRQLPPCQHAHMGLNRPTFPYGTCGNAERDEVAKSVKKQNEKQTKEKGKNEEENEVKLEDGL